MVEVAGHDIENNDENNDDSMAVGLDGRLQAHQVPDVERGLAPGQDHSGFYGCIAFRES